MCRVLVRVQYVLYESLSRNLVRTEKMANLASLLSSGQARRPAARTKSSQLKVFSTASLSADHETIAEM